MLTTANVQHFLASLMPGDVLVFSGNDPLDRLLQWIDATDYNHVGVYVGRVDGESPMFPEWQHLTLHAGLNFRGMGKDTLSDLIDKGAVERRGTLARVRLDTILGLEGDEVGGSVTYSQVTALRWNDALNPLDPQQLIAHMQAQFEVEPAPLFDYHQLPDLAEFWIHRAYGVEPKNPEVPMVTKALFDAMHPLLKFHANELMKGVDGYAAADLIPADDSADTEANATGAVPASGASAHTTCSRFVWDSFTAVGLGISMSKSRTAATEPPAATPDVRDWITPHDIWQSESFQPIVRFSRPRGH